MFDFLSFLTPATFLAAFAVALLAGTVKGLVGFAMPMIMISGLGSFLSPELALAGLMLPTLVSNGMQALRQGWRAAADSLRRFGLFLAVGFVALMGAAQLVSVLPMQALFLLIGVPVAAFCVTQLIGWTSYLPRHPSRRMEVGIALFAGFIGGLSGVWGPPVVAYLTALGTEKREQMRIQGVIYGLGAVALILAHTGSGLFNAKTAVFSAALVPAAVAGMWLGGLLQDRIDQAAFRRATLAVLLLAALNLIRRALMG